MNFKSIEEVEEHALKLMDKHGLLPDVEFKFSKAKKVAGVYTHNRKTGYRSISLSKPLTLINLDNYEFINDTILHEIAHALVGVEAGHGIVWKRKCLEVGCKPSRYVSEGGKRINKVKMKYKYTCINCGDVAYFDTVKEIACGDCCRRYNRGIYNHKYKMKVERVDKEN